MKRLLKLGLVVTLVVAVLMPALPVLASPGWVSPTDFVDGGGTWTDETLAYDENTGTYAYADSLKRGWTDNLELTVGVIIAPAVLAISNSPSSEFARQSYAPGDEIIEKRTRSSKTTYLGNSSYAWDSTIGAIHYQDNGWQEIDNELVPGNAPWDWVMVEAGYKIGVKEDFTSGQILSFWKQGSAVTLQPMALEWTNNLDMIQLVSMPQDVNPTITNPIVDLLPAVGMPSHQGTITWDNAYGSGIDFEWQCTATRLNKILTISGLNDLPPPAQYIQDGGNPVLRLNLIFSPSSDVDIYVNNQLWDKSSKQQTFDILEFRKDGEVLWGFMPLMYWDSAGDVGQSVATLEKKGPSLYISIRVPYEWLQTAVYPVFIDVNIDKDVVATGDDGYAYSTTFFADSSQLRMGRSEIYDIRTFVRFTGVTIPSGATIGANCYASVFVWNTTQPGVYLKIKADDLANPNAPINATEVFAITPTTAGVDWDDQADVDDWANTPDIQSVIAELQASYDYSAGAAITIIVDNDGSADGEILYAWSWDYSDQLYPPKLHIEYTIGAEPPTVTTQAATNIEATTATGNGNITAVNDGTCDIRGFVWDLATHGDPGNVSPAVSDYANDVSESNSFGTGAFTGSLTGLPTGNTIYVRAYAHNENGYGYGNEISFLTKPAAPTNVSATDGVHTDKVVITWTKSTGTTNYKIYEGVNLLDTVGDVATFDDNTAPAGTVTPGTATASDGTFLAHSVLSLAGEGINDGAPRIYKIVAVNASGDSDDSTTDDGFRRPTDLTLQWYRSQTDVNSAPWDLIAGGTTDPYNDTGFPVNGDGRWVYCEVNATGAAALDSTHDRGYRGVLPTVTVQAVTDISYFTATGNGNITVIGSDNCDKRGFVWDTGTHADPGNVAPGASGYANNGASTGDFGTGAYTYGLTGLLDNQIYYVRAYVHNPAGYDYSDTEVNFTTDEAVTLIVVTNNADIDGTNATLNGEVTNLGTPPVDYRGFVWGTTSYTSPGATAPAASDYDNYWTESDGFGLESFNHDISELTALTTYYYRACAHNDEGWAYGEEISFFPVVEGKVYLEFRPDLDETYIRGQAGVPSDVNIGELYGYSLPLWNEDAEELHYVICVPDRWDGESDILLHIDCALANANESGHTLKWAVIWEHYTPNEDIIPATGNTVNHIRLITSDSQYQSHQCWIVIDHDVDVGDTIEADDLIAFTLRRVTATPADDLDGEMYVFAIDVLFARGDVLGDPVGWIESLIEEGTLIGGEGVLFLALIGLALGLTWFQTRIRGPALVLMTVVAMTMWGALGAVLWTSPDTVGLPATGTNWSEYLSYVFFGLIIVPLVILMQKSIGTTKSMRDASGRVFSTSEEATKFRWQFGKKKPTSLERQTDYKERLRGKTGRK